MDERIITNENIFQQENSNFKGDIFKLDKKILGESIISCKDISKIYTLPGSEEKVVALKKINLSEDSEFYPIKRGEFIIIRGPSGNYFDYIYILAFIIQNKLLHLPIQYKLNPCN